MLQFLRSSIMNPVPFDEDDSNITIPLGQSVALVSSQTFPSLLIVNDAVFTRRCVSALKLQHGELIALLQLLQECIGSYYTIHKGDGWKPVKLEEMLDPALVYVWYEMGPEIIAFVSFRIVAEGYGNSLYLYEIHVKPQFQAQKLGSVLINSFHSLAACLDAIGAVANDARGERLSNAMEIISQHKLNVDELSHLVQSQNFVIAGTGLTVFSDNIRPLKWYFSLGYILSNDSPVDRNLRGGVVKRPEFYILYRPINH